MICQQRTSSSSPTPPSHGSYSDNEDLSDGGSSDERTTLTPFVEFHNGVNSYNTAAGRDDERGKDGVGAAGIDAALRLVLRRGHG